MADFLHDDVFDNGLNALTNNTENLYICSTLPTTFTEASSTYKLGVKATPTVGAPADRSGGGREVTVTAITDGSVTADGTAGYYALTDDSASKLLAQGSLSATQVVTNGNTFTLTSFKIGIPDPA
jgi:hypothetical protein